LLLLPSLGQRFINLPLGSIWTLSVSIQQEPNLFLQGLVSEQGVYRFAASDAIIILTPAAIGTRNQVLDAGIGLRKCLLAEKAPSFL
jgi:hypothetical protein